MTITNKMGLDDFLVEYSNSDLSKIMKTAKTFNTFDMQAEMLLKGISSVNEAKSLDWVIPDLCARGYVSFLFGEAGCKKTWLLLHTGLNLSNGYDIFDRIEVEPSKVLLFEGDTPDAMIKQRLNQLKIKTNDANFTYVNRYNADEEGVDINLSTKTGRKYIESMIANFKPDIVFFDTLISFIDTDESKQEEMKTVTDTLRKFASIYNCHIMVCHHSRKRESGEMRKKLDQSDMIGSSVMSRLAGVILGVDKGEKDEEGILSIKKSWFKPFDSLKFELIDMPENRIKIEFEAHSEANNKAEAMKNKIIEYIKTKSKTELTRKELVEAFEEESAVKKALKMLEMDGYIQGGGNTKNRIYTVIPPKK